jgi:hypothetical protein
MLEPAAGRQEDRFSGKGLLGTTLRHDYEVKDEMLGNVLLIARDNE